MTAMVNPVLPASLKANPRLSRWISIHANGTVSMRSGKVNLGQGISTALAQIVADGLGVSLGRIRMEPADTATSPDEGVTSGSLSVQESGSALRSVCEEVRNIYGRAAAAQLGLPDVSAATLNVQDGVISAANTPRTTSYWALADDTLLDVDAGSGMASEATALQRVANPFVGESVPRADIVGKLSGARSFVHDLRLPGMVFGRVVRPPSTGAQLVAACVEPALAQTRALPGVLQVVRNGRFLGVVAKTEYQAVQAAAQFASHCQWTESAKLPDVRSLGAFLLSQPVETTLVGERTPAPAALAPAAMRAEFSAVYSRPFLAHASIGPSCSVAQWHSGDSGSMADCRLEVWSHTQGIFNLRADLALMLNLPAPSITVHHAEGAGCYGHNGADDVAADAALLAQALPGLPVQVIWSREDELGMAPFGPAMQVALSAELDRSAPQGARIVNWRHEVWSNGHGSRPGRSKVSVLLAANLIDGALAPQLSVNAPLAAGGGAERNSMPLYAFPACRATSHRLLTMPVRSSALRSLGAHANVFAAESFMDEIACALDEDTLAFRLRHLDDERARQVLLAAAQYSGGFAESPENRVGLRRADGGDEACGLGLAVSRYKNTGAYCAVVARVDASREVRVTDLWIAVDVGQVVNPDGVANQIEGGAIQTVSWVMKEAVQFDAVHITSTSWETYPILRFSEVPRVHVQIIDRPAEKSVGAGEATHGPVAAAIANAIFQATGLRLRDMPFTADRIRQAALAQ